MKRLSPYPSVSLPEAFWAALLLASLNLVFSVAPSKAEPFGNNGLPKQREIHNTFSGNQENGAILDSTNPMDLLNRLRRATAMDNATTPSDAIDEALKALDAQELENSSLERSNPLEKFDPS